MLKVVDTIIIGAGIVGASLACLFAKQGLTVALVEAESPDIAWPIEKYSLRVSAINRASEKLFQAIGIWKTIASLRVSAYQHMLVWDSIDQGIIEFDAKQVAEPNLGYIIENQVITKSLHEKITQLDNVNFYCPVKSQKIIQKGDSIIVQCSDTLISANLLVGADGAHSWVREQLNIRLKEKPYGHIALVTTLKIEKSHRKTAWQCFMPEGPIALLPLENPHYCSMVWSTSPSRVKELMNMQDVDFNQAVTCVFKKYLGYVEKVDELIPFPLYQRHVENYVKNHVALVGDAAHTIHPLAGQGVNLGLADAAYLAEVISEAKEKQKDWSQHYVLRRYERTRKSENWNMIMAVKGLKQLFGQPSSWLSKLRSFGFNTVNKSAIIKQRLMRCALGI